MTYHYTYITANENGFFYVGRHSTSNIKDGYQGSGKWVKLCQEKNIVLHTRILNFYTDLESLKKAEEILIDTYFSYDKNMNLSTVSSGFSSGEMNPAKNKAVIAKRPQNNKGAKTSWFCDSTKINPGSLEKNKKRNSEMLKKLWQDPDYRKNRIDNHHSKTLEHKNRFSENNPMFNPEVKEKVRRKVLQSIIDGTHNSTILIECPHCKKVTPKPNAMRWHFDRCKSQNNKSYKY